MDGIEEISCQSELMILWCSYDDNFKERRTKQFIVAEEPFVPSSFVPFFLQLMQSLLMKLQTKPATPSS